MKNYSKRLRHMVRLMKKLECHIPETLAAYNKMEQQILQDEVLPIKTKELIALGIAMNGKCDATINLHIQQALNSGASQEEIMEVLAIAIMVTSEPTLLAACRTIEMISDCEKNTHPAGLFDQN